MMADLPSERLAFQNSPFRNVCLDYFDPFYAIIRRSPDKKWGFLISFPKITAVHVEIAHSMDINSCVMGIERFTYCRERPLVISSNNGTYFVSTEKELLLCLLNLHKQKIASKIAEKGVKWELNPLSATNNWGVWERLVRSFTQTLNAVLGNRRLTDKTLLTTSCFIGQLLNNRPFTAASSDANDLDALTPNHFFFGLTQYLPSFTPPVDDFVHWKRYVGVASVS